jgi:DNA polymerase-3 subunit gamma/tau
MSEYKVSALKYRPQRFDEVCSQEFVTQTLRNSVLSGKVANSYLLSGPRGIGKTTIARIFAKALNCTSPKEGEPCNRCEHCIEITAGTHPDVFELDAASNRGIDDVRAIQDAAKYFPLKARYKFFIVDEVHMLTPQAFNALLKILEEPPNYLIFILATTNPEKIPKTIISRCQRFALHKIKISEISARLLKIAKEEKVSIDDESIFYIAKLAEGALRDALGIFDMAVSYFGHKIEINSLREFLNLPDKEIYFLTSNYILNSDSKSLLELLNQKYDTGLDLYTFYNGLIEHFRNCITYLSTGDLKLIDESDYIRSKYQEISGKFTEDQLLRLLKLLLDNETRFKYSANQKIFLESLLVELCRIHKEVIDLDTIITEFEKLKNYFLKGSNSLNITSAKESRGDTDKVIEKLVKYFNLEKYGNK